MDIGLYFVNINVVLAVYTFIDVIQQIKQV